jgi:hypothetical protein
MPIYVRIVDGTIELPARDVSTKKMDNSALTLHPEMYRAHAERRQLRAQLQQFGVDGRFAGSGKSGNSEGVDGNV